MRGFLFTWNVYPATLDTDARRCYVVCEVDREPTDRRYEMLGPHIIQVDGEWYVTTDPRWPEHGEKLAGPCDTKDNILEKAK